VANRASTTLENIRKSKDQISSFKRINLNPTMLRFAISESLKSAFPSSSLPVFDCIAKRAEATSAINMNASAGYPTMLKKKHLKSEIYQMFDDLCQSKLELLRIPQVFLQFTKKSVGDKGKIKTRIFFAPTWQQTVLETFLGHGISHYFQQQSASSILVGKTQMEIATEVSQYKDYYCYSFDYSKYDRKLPLVFIQYALIIFKTLSPGHDKY